MADKIISPSDLGQQPSCKEGDRLFKSANRRLCALLFSAAFPFALLGSASIAAEPPSVEIEVGNPGAGDDYVCWAPVPARARLAVAQAAPQKVSITTTPHDPANGSGELAFVDVPGAGGLPVEAVNSVSQIEIELPHDATWRNFYVIGQKASSTDKDVAIVAADETGAELARRELMVRVRKNAEELTDAERDRFLDAFTKAAAHNNQFDKFWKVHSDGDRLAHRTAFFPWHRAFLIQFERELQAQDRTVALPYWEFDKLAPKLFTRDFIGWVDPAVPGDKVVAFSIANPLSQWTLGDPRVSPLVRRRNGDSSVSPLINKDFMTLSEYALVFPAAWGAYHGQAHVHINGIVGDILRSPADPLFFLLHANVDRGWAAWQRLHNRFDRSQTATYPLQGAHGAGAMADFGNFADDTMWPWDGIIRPTSPPVLVTSPVVMPPNPGPIGGLSGTPAVGDTLDYLDLAGMGSAESFCYDDIPYGAGPVPEFWP